MGDGGLAEMVGMVKGWGGGGGGCLLVEYQARGSYGESGEGAPHNGVSYFATVFSKLQANLDMLVRQIQPPQVSLCSCSTTLDVLDT